ncbi:hypothetical protein ZWY2020_006118 [Hordeum vulgare]|nr:hypothetical protein ZWY2020_006118 [Hordeum vulgare]
MMFPLHFHYEDVLRQDLLLKLNHANVMEVPGLFEIRLVPKAASDFRIQFGKLAMEILCGQRFIQTQRALFSSRKVVSIQSILGVRKDTLDMSVTLHDKAFSEGMECTIFGKNLDSNVYRFSGRNTENSIKFFMETEFCEFSRIGRSFRDLRAYSRVQCDYCHFGQYKR